MKNECKKNTYIFVIAVAFCIVLSGNIYSSIQSYRYRRLCNQYTEQLIAAEERNREFEDRFGRVQEVVGRLSETANSNVTDARGIIEIVERLRAEVQELENICYGGNTLDSYYDWFDSELGLQ